MASIKEAYDSTMKEAFTGIKIFIWAFPIAYALYQIKQLQLTEHPLTLSAQNIIVISILFLLIGFVVTLARNVVSKAQYVVPGINIFQLIINGLLGIVATAPYAIAGGFIYYASKQLMLPDEIWDATFHVIVFIYAIALPISGICMLVRRMNIIEAFNLKKTILTSFDVFLDISYFTFRLFIVAGTFYWFFSYLFSLFIGFDNTFWLYLIGIGIMTLIVLYANAIAQISDDLYTFREKEELKKKEDALVKKVIEEQSEIKDMR